MCDIVISNEKRWKQNRCYYGYITMCSIIIANTIAGEKTFSFITYERGSFIFCVKCRAVLFFSRKTQKSRANRHTHQKLRRSFKRPEKKKNDSEYVGSSALRQGYQCFFHINKHGLWTRLNCIIFMIFYAILFIRTNKFRKRSIPWKMLMEYLIVYLGHRKFFHLRPG